MNSSTENYHKRLPGQLQRPYLALDTLYNPRAIAIVGASPNPGKRGRIIIENLMQLGFPGEIYPINPKYARILGHKCYPSIAELPARVDVAAICLPCVAAVRALAECGRLGIRAAAIIANGFAESGPTGYGLQEELVGIAEQYQITVSGPNSLGLMDCASRVCYWAAPPRSNESSNVAAVVQSGALALSLIAPAHGRGLSFEAVAMPGNEALVTTSDHVNYLIEREGIDVVALIVEGIRDPQGFIDAARRAALQGKRIIALKLGTSAGGQRAAAAHTASLAVPDKVFSAVCDRYGVIRVHDIDELIEATLLASTLRMLRDPRVVITSVSGAGCGLAADMAEEVGIKLVPPSPATSQRLLEIIPGSRPGNPFDVGLAFDVPGSYADCVDILASSSEYDVQIMMLNSLTPDDANRAFYLAQLKDGARFVSAGRQTIACSFTSGEHDDVLVQHAASLGIPVLQGLRESFLAVRRYAAAVSQSEMFASETNPQFPSLTRNMGPSWSDSLSDTDGRDLISAYGIPVARRVRVTKAEEAVLAAEKIGYPVAMKLWSPNVVHKSDVGGVVLGLTDPASVVKAFNDIATNLAKSAPSATFDGAFVEEMADGSCELIIGIKNDDQFGVLLLVGIGGIFVEILNDTILAVPPVGLAKARGMLSSLKGYHVLTGARGAETADIEEAAKVIVAMSTLAMEWPLDLHSLEINPLVVGRSGCGVLVVDSMIDYG